MTQQLLLPAGAADEAARLPSTATLTFGSSAGGAITPLTDTLPAAGVAPTSRPARRIADGEVSPAREAPPQPQALAVAAAEVMQPAHSSAAFVDPGVSVAAELRAAFDALNARLRSGLQQIITADLSSRAEEAAAARATAATAAVAAQVPAANADVAQQAAAATAPAAVVALACTRELREPCAICTEPVMHGQWVAYPAACLGSGASHAAFHELCLRRWFHTSATCPMCRA